MALNAPNQLLAISYGQLLRSKDAGCTWTVMSPMLTSVSRLTRARDGDIVQGWGVTTGFGCRIEGETVVTSHSSSLIGLTVAGAGTRPSDAIVALESGHIYWDFDRGVDPPSAFGSGATVAFDPSNPDHAVFGDKGLGASVTFDRGATWTQSTGMSLDPAGSVATNGLYAYSVAVSPADPNVVWIVGRADVMHLYRSNDGGRSFTTVLDDSQATPFFMWTLLAPHPTNADVLYWVGRAGLYEDALFRYDHASGAVASHSYPGLPAIDAIEFSPVDPEVMYLGVSDYQPT